MSATKILWGQITVVFLIVLLTIWGATEWTAWRLGFQLVPWSREIERKLGQHVAGVTKDGGGIEWTLGRKRDLGL